MLLPIYAAVAVIMLVHVALKKYSIVKRWDRNHLLLVYKQAHDKRGIAESLHVYVYRASIRGAYFEEKIATLKNMSPFIRNH